MKVSIGMNLTTAPWGGGNQFGQVLVTLLKQRGVEVCFDLNAPDLDVILLADPRPELQITAYTHHDIIKYLRWVNSRALVVHRVNECDERKGETNHVNPRLRQGTLAADHTVFVSSWLRDLHLSQGMKPQSHSVILNGSDTRIFNANGHRRWNRKSPLKLVTHHWGHHWLKGFDIYQRIDDLVLQKNIEFTYIGKLPDGFQLKNARYIMPKSGKELADILRQHHVYVTGSQFEPGSNHQNEGALCGLPLLYRESGSLPEYCAGFGIGFEAEDFEEKLDRMLAEYEVWADRMPAYPHTADRTADAYFQLFANLLENRDALLAQRQWPEHLPVIEQNKNQAIRWLHNLRDPLINYVQSLKIGDGRYTVASQGMTEAGQGMRLAFSCWALKMFYMLGAKDGQDELVNFIRLFQVNGNPLHLPFARNAFLDPVLIKHIVWARPRRQRLFDRIFRPRRFTHLQAVVSAETKQAIASLAQVGAQTAYPYTGFPHSPDALMRYLQGLNWSNPWESGAHIATIAVYLRTEAPRFLPQDKVHILAEICRRFINSLIDQETGAYFRGQKPDYGQMVNGAMKILTALEWLEIPIHCPEKLIDTVLSHLPEAEGCYLVDAVYVLYRCTLQTDYRKTDIQAYAVQLVDLLVNHFNPLDGGFSYYLGRSQPFYYEVRITHQHPVSDLHGTVLLTWAAAMILKLLEADSENWHVMKA